MKNNDAYTVEEDRDWLTKFIQSSTAAVPAGKTRIRNDAIHKSAF